VIRTDGHTSDIGGDSHAVPYNALITR